MVIVQYGWSGEGLVLDAQGAPVLAGRASETYPELPSCCSSGFLPLLSRALEDHVYWLCPCECWLSSRAHVVWVAEGQEGATAKTRTTSNPKSTVCPNIVSLTFHHHVEAKYTVLQLANSALSGDDFCDYPLCLFSFSHQKSDYGDMAKSQSSDV